MVDINLYQYLLDMNYLAIHSKYIISETVSKKKKKARSDYVLSIRDEMHSRLKDKNRL